jgi:hypothetical protein
MTRRTKTLSAVAATAVVALGTVGAVDAKHGTDPAPHHNHARIAGAVGSPATAATVQPRHGRSLDDLPNHP